MSQISHQNDNFQVFMARVGQVEGAVNTEYFIYFFLIYVFFTRV